MKRLYFLLFFLAAIIPGVQAQLSPEAIEKYFNEYQVNTLQEKLFVITDKEDYLAGDIIWFKVHYVEANTNMALDISKIAYLEIVDADNKAVLQTKISLSKGTGNGSLYLPSSLRSGHYSLRAYTSWMKNFDPGFYFHKSLKVFNTLREENAPVRQAEAKNGIQFFPEGGNLVSGIESKIAFKAVDESGKGLEFRGSVVDNRGDTISRFSPTKFGIGAFFFKPAMNENYRVVIKPKAGREFATVLPQVFETGYVISLLSQGDMLKVKATTNQSYQRALTLFIHSGRNIRFNKTTTLAQGTTEFDISSSLLGEGISHITLFNEEGVPVCERLYFKKPEKRISIVPATNKKEYASREKVNLDFTFNAGNTSSVKLGYSVSVYKTDSLQSSQPDALSFLWLTSELKGRIEDPSFYLNAATDSDRDNLVLTQGWRRFRWEDLFAKTEKPFSVQPEVDRHIVRAKVINSETKKPISGIPAFLTVPSKAVKLYTAVSNSQGELNFYVDKIYGAKELIAQVDPRIDSLAEIEILSPFSTNYDSFSPSYNPFIVPKDLLSQSIAMQVRNVYLSKYLNKELLPESDSIPFYTYANRSYKLDDYVRFVTMEEVLREYVPEISVAIRKKSYHLKMLDPEINEFYTSAPLILVDGVPVFDEGTTIIRYDPLKVQRFDVVDRRYYYGANVYDGIASFITYKGDLAGLELTKNSTVVDYAGIQPSREFYSPMYEGDLTASARIPDYRTTLFWHPDGKLEGKNKASLSFFTSDIKGKYFITVQALDEAGWAGSGSGSFIVK